MKVQGLVPPHIAGFDGIDVKSRRADQVIYLAIEVTSSAEHEDLKTSGIANLLDSRLFQ